METSWYTFTHPKKATHYPLYTSLCTGELNAIRKQNAFAAVLSTEWRVVGPFWDKSKPKGPENLPASFLHWRAGSSRSERGLFCGSFMRKGKAFAYLGRIRNLRDLQDLKALQPRAAAGPCSIQRQELQEERWATCSPVLEEFTPSSI